MQRPRAVQFCNGYVPEWPALPQLVARALATRSGTKRLSEKFCSMFTIHFPHDPESDGVMDHMVRMTTCLASPFVATACRTVCPESPPEVGKPRLSVPEILKTYTPSPDAKCMAGESSCNSQLMIPIQVLVPYQSPSILVKFFSLPLLLHHNSIYPGSIPKIELTKSSAQTAPRENPRHSNSENKLELPKWRYQEIKEEKRKGEEAEAKSKQHKGRGKGRTK